MDKLQKKRGVSSFILLAILFFTSIIYAEDVKIELPIPPNKPILSKSKINILILNISKKYKVEHALVKAIAMSESAYNEHAVSSKGAIGVMQIMPSTAVDYGIDNPNDLFNARINVNTGVRHLKRLLRKYKNDYSRVIPAYNAGEGVVDRTNNNVTYNETIKYTAAIIRNYRRYGGKQKIDMKKAVVKHDSPFYHTDPSLLSLSMRMIPPPKYLDPRLNRPMFVLPPPKKK
jgi:soluble lytic murein transglycosylase-like protein